MDNLRPKNQESTTRSSALRRRSLAQYAVILKRFSEQRAPRSEDVNAVVLIASSTILEIRYNNQSRKRLKTRPSTRNSSPSSRRKNVPNFSSGLSPRIVESAGQMAEASTTHKPQKSGNTPLISNHPSGISSQFEDKLSKKNPMATRFPKNQVKGRSKMLLTINVLGSAGPLRFFVDEQDPVKRVIELSLQTYAHEGRLPVLGTDSRSVELYCADSKFEPLDPVVSIGSLGTRHFLLHKKVHEGGVQPAAGRHGHFSLLQWKFWSHLSCSRGDVP